MKSEQPLSLSKLEGLVFAAATLIHLTLCATYAGETFVLVSTGAVSVLAGLAWLVGLACLYLAAFRLLVQRRRANVFLGIAAIALAYSSVKLGWPYPPAIFAAAGCGLALLAWALIQSWAPGRQSDG